MEGTTLAAQETAQTTSAPKQRSELSDLLGVNKPRAPLTAETIEPIAAQADQDYEEFAAGEAGATVSQFLTWRDLTDYYHMKWHETPPETKSAIEQRRGDVHHLFNRYMNMWGGGFTKTGEDITDPAMLCRVREMIGAYRTFQMGKVLVLNGRNASNPQFLQALNDLAEPWEEFHLQNKRDQQVRLDWLAEIAGVSSRKKDELNPASMAKLYGIQIALTRAYDEFRAGQPDNGWGRLWYGIESLQLALKFGQGDYAVRDVFSNLSTQLNDSTPLAPQGETKLTFRQALQQTLDKRLAATETSHRERRVTPISLAEEAVTVTPVPSLFTETVKVEGEAPKEKVTLDTYLLHRVTLDLDEATGGQGLLARHQGLALEARGLFMPLLKARLDEKKYGDVRAAYIASLPEPERAAFANDEAFERLGSRILSNPDVHKKLVGLKLLNAALGLQNATDSPERYAHIGELALNEERRDRESWPVRTEKGSAGTREELERLARSYRTLKLAEESYMESTRLVPAEDVPAAIWLAIGNTRHNELKAGIKLATRISGLEMAVKPGTPEAERVHALITHATGGAESALNNLNPKQSVEDVLVAYDNATAAYQRTLAPATERPRIAPEEQDRLYGISLTANAAAARFLQHLEQPGRAKENQDLAKKYLELLNAPPANGHQYLLRGTLRTEVLRDEDGARRDYSDAFSLLLAERNRNPKSEYARRDLENAMSALRSATHEKHKAKR